MNVELNRLLTLLESAIETNNKGLARQFLAQIKGFLATVTWLDD